MDRSNFNWIPALFIFGYHALLLVSLPIYFFYFTPSWTLITISAVLMYVTGISVTMGYHRLYSHTTYKINRVLEAVLLFFATMATQGSALRWSFDHRHHHAFVDTDRDPYSIKKGFWYAHFLWLLEKPKEIENKVVADLVKKPLLVFQHKYYGILMLATNLVATLFMGWCLNDYVGAFLFGWFVRLFFLHHMTWFINSLAHTWGARNFCEELSAVDNYLIALLTFGEGYHNYHHTFANDYRNGIRWYHFDPTKWLIWTASKLGLAGQLKTSQHYIIEKKLVLERKQVLLEKISTSLDEYKEAFEGKITELSENMLTKLAEMKQLRDQYHQRKEKNECIRDLHAEIKAIKKGFKTEFKNWMDLSRQVMAAPQSSDSSQPS